MALAALEERLDEADRERRGGHRPAGPTTPLYRKQLRHGVLGDGRAAEESLANIRRGGLALDPGFRGTAQLEPRRAGGFLTIAGSRRGWAEIRTPAGCARPSAAGSGPRHAGRSATRLGPSTWPARGGWPGRRLLVVANRGVGERADVFASMAARTWAGRRRARRSGLICEPRLQRLFSGSFPAIDVAPGPPAAAADPPAARPGARPWGGLGRLYATGWRTSPGPAPT